MSNREEFNKWFQGEQGKPYDGMYMFALAAWQARQPEIDALKKERNAWIEKWHETAIENAALKVEITKWQDETEACALCLADEHAENATLKAENERLRRDAERYQHMRANFNRLQCVRPGHAPEPDKLDNAIDAAMKEEK